MVNSQNIVWEWFPKHYRCYGSLADESPLHASVFVLDVLPPLPWGCPPSSVAG